MAAHTAGPRPPPEVIDLVSDSSSDAGGIDLESAPRSVPMQDVNDQGDAHFQPHQAPPLLDAHNDWLNDPFRNVWSPEGRTGGGQLVVLDDGEEVWIPDEEQEPQLFNNVADATATAQAADVAEEAEEGEILIRDREVAMALDNEVRPSQENNEVTVDVCLQRVLEIFPDISHEYVTNLWNDFDREGDYETLPGPARMENVIEQLVSATSYPKQDKGKQPLKRKREDSTDESSAKKWQQEGRAPVPHYLKGPTQAILKAEFPDMPMVYIGHALTTHRHLFQAYVALAKAKDDGERNSNRSYGRGRPSKKYLADSDTIATNCGWPPLLEELKAARERVAIDRAERLAEDEKKQAEQENLQKAIEAGETAECSACFDDLPMNRQIHCNGDVAHFTCFDCAETYVKSEVGESRCRVLCPAGCGAGFAHHQLDLLSDKQLLAKLAQLQQEKDIRDAGLDDLEECPFCDYKAILPPIEEDFEFRCLNPECEKVSCRRCKSISHIPMSCEQHAKENKLSSRHKIEEAMTAAMVRSCNKCKKQFIKDIGCNKMHCPSCNNLQCYVCSETIRDYNHFDSSGRSAGGAGNGKCPLYDNVEERHEREVKEAEEAARTQVVAENPDVTAEDLEIKLSDAVKKATAARVRQAGGPGDAMLGIPFEPVGPPPALFRAHRAFMADGDDEDDIDRVFNDFGGRVRAQLNNRAGIPVQAPPPRNAALQLQQQRQARLQAARAQVQARQNAMNQGGMAQVFGPPPFNGQVQGYIPVFGMQAQPAPGPVAPIGNSAAVPPPQQPFHGQQQFGGMHGVFDEMFNDPFDFGGDGAGDQRLPNLALGQGNAAANNPNNNNHNRGLWNQPPIRPRLYPGQNQLLPLGLPPPAAPAGPPNANAGPAVDRREQRQGFQQLEMLRQQHDRQMQLRNQQRKYLQQQVRQQMQRRLQQQQQQPQPQPNAAPEQQLQQLRMIDQQLRDARVGRQPGL